VSNLYKNKKALILCSSGLDSLYNFLKAKGIFKEIKVIFFDYSQKAYAKEYVHTRKLCEKFNIKLLKVDLPFYRNIKSSLTGKNNVSNYKNLKSVNESKDVAEWLPNRNAIMINAAAAFAESLNFDYIIIGINKEEASRYKDNSEKFLTKINELLNESLINKVKVESFSISLNKTEILKEFLKQDEISLDFVWSCYESYEKMCGVCESCLRLKNAIKKNNLEEKWKSLFLK
jgi:7-cyano-7-deazaguanine synthase